jgi:PAS domain S-box-containing protein
MPAAIAMFDRQMRYLAASNRFIEEYGLKDKELLGRSYYEVHPETPERYKAAFQRCLAGVPEKCDEEAFVHANGSSDWMRWEVVPWYEENNEIGGIILFSEIITQRKQREEVVKVRQFSLDHAPDSVFWMGPKGNFVYVNDTACQTLGYSKEELLSMGVSDIDPNFPNGVPAEMAQNTERAGFSSVESVHKTKSGHVFPVELQVAYIEIEEKKYHCCFARDISERKRAEEALLKLSEAIKQAGESVIITDMEGTIEYVNPAFTKITGFASEEAMGKNPRILKSGNQTDEYYKRLWDTISRGEVFHSSVIDRRRDGSQYPAMMTISPIFDKDGEITHYVGIQQDMTDHDILEEQFRQAQKMEALGTLIGGIAHDFNNILTGITGNISIAKYEMNDFPEAVAKLKVAEDLGFQAADMIKQLMAFSRKGLIKKRPFGLTSFIEKISRLVKSSIPENITFRLEHCDEELVVKGDPTQLQQVLVNILNNARDAVADVTEAAITLKIEEFEGDQAFIKNHPDSEGRLFAHLIIEDNGCGIPDGQKKRLFEPFFTTKEVGLGTGLGLSMAYGTIQSHHGIIEVESTQGEGSVFHVYLPLVEERSIDIATEEAPEIVSGNGELILIVDDNADVRKSIKENLTRINYTILEASDGLEAVDIFAANSDEIALVIMDVVMPRLGGVKAVERIRKIQPDIKVIYSTGYDKDETLKKDMPSDEYIVLSKPYSTARISQEIRTLLDS